MSDTLIFNGTSTISAFGCLLFVPLPDSCLCFSYSLSSSIVPVKSFPRFFRYCWRKVVLSSLYVPPKARNSSASPIPDWKVIRRAVFSQGLNLAGDLILFPASQESPVPRTRFLLHKDYNLPYTSPHMFIFPKFLLPAWVLVMLFRWTAKYIVILL